MITKNLLDEIEDFLEDHQDVRDGAYGEPIPNRAMCLLAELRTAREARDRRIRQCNCYLLPHADDCSIFVGITQSGERLEERRRNG